MYVNLWVCNLVHCTNATDIIQPSFVFLQGTDGEPGEKGEDGESGQPVSTCQMNEVLDVNGLIRNDCS